MCWKFNIHLNFTEGLSSLCKTNPLTDLFIIYFKYRFIPNLDKTQSQVATTYLATHFLSLLLWKETTRNTVCHHKIKKKVVFQQQFVLLCSEY